MSFQGRELFFLRDRWRNFTQWSMALTGPHPLQFDGSFQINETRSLVRALALEADSASVLAAALIHGPRPHLHCNRCIDQDALPSRSVGRAGAPVLSVRAVPAEPQSCLQTPTPLTACSSIRTLLLRTRPGLVKTCSVKSQAPVLFT